MVVIEGAQAIGKSTFCTDLAGAVDEDLFSDSDLLGLSVKEQMEQMQGVWVYEVAELAGMRRTEVEKTKALITRRHDRARAAYARFKEQQPRRCIFIGTTNNAQYLRDATGNRRSWPVAVTRYDREAFVRDRDQVFAEAAHAEAAGEKLYLAAHLHDAASARQQSRMVEDPWVDILSRVEGEVRGNVEVVASNHLLREVLGLSADRIETARASGS